MLLDNSNLTARLIPNQTIPDEGPKAIPIRLDFSVAGGSITSYSIDLLITQERALLTMVQTLYIDLSTAVNDLIVTVGGSNQIIQAEAGTQGYYPVLCPNPPKFQFDVAAPGDVDTVFLINVPIAGVVWTV